MSGSNDIPSGASAAAPDVPFEARQLGPTFVWSVARAFLADALTTDVVPVENYDDLAYLRNIARKSREVRMLAGGPNRGYPDQLADAIFQSALDLAHARFRAIKDEGWVDPADWWLALPRSDREHLLDMWGYGQRTSLMGVIA